MIIFSTYYYDKVYINIVDLHTNSVAKIPMLNSLCVCVCGGILNRNVIIPFIIKTLSTPWLFYTINTNFK